jgi:hypothetical protein
MASTSSNIVTPNVAFEEALTTFKKTLSKKHQENFKNTSLEELKKDIAELQAKQQSSRRMQNLNRIKPFLEAMDQFGKVIEPFCNIDGVAFVWVCCIENHQT